MRARVGDDGPRLVAKIETGPAVDVLDEILEACDALMVARGDLGIECPLEDVPHLQKHIIRAAVQAGVPVITATQMLESMITAPAPTRAEVSDVANAVFDGTDAVMLSGETAIGHDPALVVRTMATVAARAEEEANYAHWAVHLGRVQRRQWPDGSGRITMAITHAASQAATDAAVEAIVCCTRSGRTARAMARFRPTAKLIAVSPDPRTTRAMALSWGVIPMSMTVSRSTDELIWLAIEDIVRAGHAGRGDLLLILAGSPEQQTRCGDRRAPDRAGRVTGIAMQRQGPENGPLVVLVHGSMDRMAGMAKLARRLATDCSVISLRPTWLRRVGRPPRAVHDGAPGGRSGDAGGRPAVRARRPQLRRQRGARDGRPPSGARRRDCALRNAAVVAAVVAGHDRRRERARHAGPAGGGSRAIHAPHDRRRAVGSAPRTHEERRGGQRARRWSAS